jgi:hypothetical protein
MCPLLRQFGKKDSFRQLTEDTFQLRQSVPVTNPSLPH